MVITHRLSVWIFLFFALSLPGLLAWGDTLQLPAGGSALLLGKNRVICGPLPEGFSSDERRRTLRPPTGKNAIGRHVEILVGLASGTCSKSATPLTLHVTAPWPEIDPSSITFFADAGLLELKGQDLQGLQLFWQAGKQTGKSTCLNVTRIGKLETCTIPVERHLPSTSILTVLPAEAVLDAETFDDQGQPLPSVGRELFPARVVIEQMLPTTGSLDVAQGTGFLALTRPEAVSTVDCGVARCELTEGGITILGVPAQSITLAMRLRLAPRFLLARGEKLENSLQLSLPLLRCSLSVISGSPLRDADESHLIIKMEERCGHPKKTRWFVGSEPATVEREVRRSDGDYILLKTGRLAGGQVTISAVRSDASGGTLGSVTVSTTPAPRLQSKIELPGHGPIDFIPTNREAVLTVAGGGPHMLLVPLATAGSTAIRQDGLKTLIRADNSTSGFVNLRFGYRMPGILEDFSQVNLAILTENIQRPLREASIPTAFNTRENRKIPLAELVCSDGKGGLRPLVPGQPERIPFATRDTCRVILYQNRLRFEDGTQEIILEVEVTKSNGSKRSEASIQERMVLHPGGEPRVIYLKAGTEQFDHLVVRLSHVIDESRYVLGPLAKQRPPSLQWIATLEGGFARLYVTLAIPAGLYRMNDPVASMTLNFGVLGRITTLNHRGKEGILGIETGVLGASLIPQRDNQTTAFPRTLLTLLGFGLRVEVGEGAAVGVHLWGAYEFRKEYSYTPEGGSSPMKASHWSLIFGPSISIGSVGTNL